MKKLWPSSEQVTTSDVPNLNSNFKNIKRSLCRLPNGKAGGKGDSDGRHLAPATFATCFSLPPARQSAKDVFVDCWEWPKAEEILAVDKDSFADC